ncbi:MAG: hypothetical protein ACM3Q1_06395 [Bacteroidales bacterium]
MIVRPLIASLLLLTLAACAVPDRPASPERLGRFMGLVARCNCSDIGPARMAAEYRRAVAGRYSPAEIERMQGFVQLGGAENYSNQVPICAEVCSQTCAVNAVVMPLGGRPVGDGATCFPSEGGLALTTGWTDTD